MNITTRRSILTGSFAAFVASPGPAMAATSGREDGALFELVQAWRLSLDRYNAQFAVLDRAEERYSAMRDKGIGSAREQSGLRAAEETLRKSVAELAELEERIARTRARTIQGILLKARIVSDDPVYEDVESQLEKALEERLSTGHFMGLSLVLDILRMNEGRE